MTKYLCLIALFFISCGGKLKIRISIPENASKKDIQITLKVLSERVNQFGPNSKINYDSINKELILITSARIDSVSIVSLITLKGQLEILETYENLDLYENLLHLDSLYKLKNEGISFSDHIMIQTQSYNGLPFRDAIIGYCKQSDTVLINKILRFGINEGILPINTSFKWGFPNHQELLPLYAIKVPLDYSTVTTEMIASSEVKENHNEMHEVWFKLKSEYHSNWRMLTRNNIRKSLAFTLDDRVHSAPRVMSEIPSGETVISGNYTREEAKVISCILNNGVMPLKLEIIEVKR